MLTGQAVPVHQCQLTWEGLEHALVLHFNHQIEMGAVAQGDHLTGPTRHEAIDPQGQLQGLAHTCLHLARGELHAAGLGHVYLQMGHGLGHLALG